MIVLDVNVLLAVFRKDHAHHELVRPWFERLRGEDTMIVPDLVWVGFLRLVTNNHVFGVPSALGDALAFQNAVMGSRGYRATPGLPEGWTDFGRLAVEARASGNLIPDAYVAAIASNFASPVATMDRDFRRFEELRVVDPTTR